MVYRWKTPFPGKGVTAQVVGERLEAIRKKNQLTAKAIVDDARPDDSPLHPCFEWNDEAAADKYREDQARTIIRNIEVVVENKKGEDRPVRAFVHVTENEDSQYTSISAAMANPDLRRQVLDNALRELNSWRDRYSDLRELAELLTVVDTTLLKFGT